AAYLYQSPGAFAITLIRTLPDGVVRTYACSIIVPAAQRTVYYIASTGDDANTGVDPAHALHSATAAAAHLRDHTELRFQCGSVFPIDRAFDLTHRDVVLDCFGDPTLPLPVIYR